MPTYKTPGVYVEEISVFPPSVAEVETAIPAFIGYTEKAEKNGEDLNNTPTKISSLLDYRQYFGGGHAVDDIEVVVEPSNNYAVDVVNIPKRFYMFDALRLFFDNGGGDCYIVSVGTYEETSAISSSGLQDGLDKLQKYDEPTLILFPDAVLLGDENTFYTLQQRALSQCAKLQDRFSIFDLKENDVTAWEDSYSNFRDNIGINNLKYGAAYTPWLITSYTRDVDFDLLWDVEDQSYNIVDPSDNEVELHNITSDSTLNALAATARDSLGDRKVIEDTVDGLRGASETLNDRYKTLRDAVAAADNDGDAESNFITLLELVRSAAVQIAGWQEQFKGENLLKDLDTYAQDKLQGAIYDLVALEKEIAGTARSDLGAAGGVDTAYSDYNGTGWLKTGESVSDIGASGTDYTDGGSLSGQQIALAIAEDLDLYFGYVEQDRAQILSFITELREAAKTQASLAQQQLYQEHDRISNIVSSIKRELSKLPPSGAVAGVYAQVDGTRGVWKAPANVSLTAVAGPTEPIDRFDQAELNVDPDAGKSINAIRAFSGKGTLVWGARTLAGNDNEWRYISVRRFFNVVEESVKKSTGWAVFEPNDANTWTRVQTMIQNYLIQKWRDGALAGATPDEAFFVKVGLGQTMTAQDVLEGRMNVEIGMAVVRPAEFIILKFSHKMQES